MTLANAIYDTLMRELNDNQVCDNGETPEKHEVLSFQEEMDEGDIPTSLLSYFESSKSRAAACEKLILEGHEDFFGSHDTEDMKVNEQLVGNPETFENNSSSDSLLLHAPAESEDPLTQDTSVWPNDEGEAETDDYEEAEDHLMFEGKLLQISLDEEVKLRREEARKEELRRQNEDEFQKELKKIIEAGKLHQKELELMEKKAQEKLEQELQLQQEAISSLQRRVEEERRRMEEEQRRLKEEERRREEERRLKEAERRMEEEERRLKEEERRMEEEERRLKEEEERKREEERRLKEEEERRRMEEEQRRLKEEEERRREEERRLKEEEERRMEEEQRRLKKEEERRRMEEEQRRLKEEERRRMEEEQRRLKEEERRMEEEQRRLKEEEERMKKEKARKEMKEAERRRKDEERKKEEEERKRMEEEQRRLKDEEEERKREEKKIKEEAERKRMEEMERRRKDEDMKLKIEEERKRMDEEERKRQKDEERKIEEMELKKEEERKRRKESEEKRMSEKEERTLEDERRKKKKEEEEKRGEEGTKIEKVRRMERERRKREQEMMQEEKERKKSKEESLRSEEEKRKRLEEEQKKKVTEERKGEERTQRKEEGRLEDEKEEKKKQKREEGEKKGKEEGTGRQNTEEARTITAKEEDERNTIIQEKMHKDEGKTAENGNEEEERETGPSHTSSAPPISTETTQNDPDRNTRSLPVFLPEHTELKRLSWMKECVSWSRLSLQNRRKQRASHGGSRGVRKAGEVSSLPPLCADLLLQSTGWKTLREVTSVTLEDLPGCSLSSLSQCSQLQSLTLRRCGLRFLEGIGQLAQLSYIDAQENEISFMDCENLTSLRVLKLSHNKLTSIHGLTGAENLEVLELSHNCITRIAGLESMKRLQKLSLDHNQLISTEGLRDVYTLLHLDCSHNHLLRVEAVETCGLLSTLDLRANSLTEPPALNNQVLLRELRLDDNSVSSLRSLADCWLPLLQRLSVAQNRITQLPCLSDAVSLSYLDLRFNCLSELQNVSESLEGCPFLRELHLTGNPLQQESGWRSSLQRALPSLRAIDDQGSDIPLSPPAGSVPSGSFLALCQAQLQQTHDLQQRLSGALSKASSPLDAVKISCRHFSAALQLALDQRFAHEYGDTSVAAKHEAADQTADKETHEVSGTEVEFTGNDAPVIPNRDDAESSFWTSEAAAGSLQDSRYSDETGPEREPEANRANSSNQQDPTLQQRAAAVTQQLWRKHTQKCGNIRRTSTAERGGGGGGGGDGGQPESGPAVNRRAIGKDHAATVIQAVWRGFTLRRRLASALAAVTCSDTGEDDTFEEVDVDEFVFDEAALEKDWTLLSEDPPSRCLSVSEQQLTLKLPEGSQYVLPPQLVLRSKQAWVDEEQEDSGGRRVSPVSSVRSKPPSAPVPGGLSEKSKILEEWGFTHSHTALMMLKRAQKMKPKKQQPEKRRDPSACQSLFRNRSYQMDPAGAQKRRANHNRNDAKVCELDLDLDLERVKQDRAQLWLRSQAALPDGDSESLRFLPELSSGVLSGGRVQLVADPGYSERQHHGSGSRANSSSAARPCRGNSSPHSSSSGRARKEAPAPSKKERISFRDNRVQLSGGWGGGKKRDRVHK